MSTKRNIALLACPGGAKTTFGLSAPGVEQHVWGSSEEATRDNFPERVKSGDILEPVKFNWYDCLDEKEKAKFTDESVSEIAIGELTKVARAKNIAKYRRYLYKLKNEHKPDEKRKTLFMDNGTAFSQDFEDYVRVVYGAEFATKEGNFNSIAFAIKFKNEYADFMRMFLDLPYNCIVSYHIAMTLDEATAAKADFMKDTAKGIKYPKEWQPMVMGQAKYLLAGLYDFAFYMWTEESAGQPTRFLAKLEADDSSVGMAKGRIQPFLNPRKIEFPKNRGFEYLEEALRVYRETGIPFNNDQIKGVK